MKHLDEVKLRDTIHDVLFEFLASKEKADQAAITAVDQIMAAIHAVADSKTEAAR